MPIFSFVLTPSNVSKTVVMTIMTNNLCFLLVLFQTTVPGFVALTNLNVIAMTKLFLPVRTQSIQQKIQNLHVSWGILNYHCTSN